MGFWHNCNFCRNFNCWIYDDNRVYCCTRFSNANCTRGFKLFCGNYYAANDATFCASFVPFERAKRFNCLLKLFPSNFTNFFASSKYAGNFELSRSPYWNFASCHFCDFCRVASCANLPLWNNLLWFKSES